MQDLTLINADDDLVLRPSEVRMRREHTDDMGSGVSTLPRAKSTAARQSKAAKQKCDCTLVLLDLSWTLRVVLEPCDLNDCMMKGKCKRSECESM